MRRIFFLIAIAIVQLVVGSLMMYGAAAPVRVSQDVFVPSGGHHHFEFGVLSSGRLIGNLSEFQGRSLDLFIFDDRGYSSFRDGTNAVPPLFARNGTDILFVANLAGPGQYHAVIVDFPTKGELRVHLDLVVVGLKTVDTILAVLVLVGGLALAGGSLMMSVWSSRRSSPAPDPPAESQDPPGDPSDDNTRVY